MSSKGIRYAYRFLVAVCLLTGVDASAQYNELGLLLGGSTYKGDLSPQLFKTYSNHPAAGIFFRHNWNRHWSWKVALNYGRVSADDADSDIPFNVDRNLSFRSNVFDITPLIEFNFLPYETGNRYYPFTPYLFTGITVFHFNPKAELGDDLYELQPLTTEGQKPYKRWQFAVPIGGGLKFTVGRIGLGIEMGVRRTYTDYLDDVSSVYPDAAGLLADKGAVAVALSDRSFSSRDTSNDITSSYLKLRGNSEDKDWYLFGGITVYYRLSSLLKDICKPFKNRRYT
ncbi:MAG: hypothetical protein RL213_798 [Bacteroidota bacterium]|jgi:hypothetical protein